LSSTATSRITPGSFAADTFRPCKAFATAYGRYYRFPREDFFGLGPDSRKADKSDFDLRQGTVGVSGVKSNEDAQIAKAGIAAIGL